MFLSLRKKGALNLPLLSTIEEERIDEKFFYSSLAVSFLNNGLKVRKFYLDVYYTLFIHYIFAIFQTDAFAVNDIVLLFSPGLITI